MFVVNDDNSIYATRGDIVFFSVTAEDDGKPYKFQAGDVVRISVYGKKNCENVVLQKDFPVDTVTENVEIFLTSAETKFEGLINKPKDYWYEVVLNPYDNPQTIVGYGEDGAVLFRLFPEGDEIEEPETEPEDIPVVDTELDMTSPRPVENRVVARAFAGLEDGFERVFDAVAKLYVTPKMFGAIGDGESDDTEALNSCFAYARENSLNVFLETAVYCVGSPLTTDLTFILYGNNATLKASKAMDAVIIVDKPNEALSVGNGGSAIFDLNIDGNSLASKGVFVKYGKGITLRDIHVKGATHTQMQVCDTDQQVWELVVDNVELRSEYNGGYSPYGLRTFANNTDSYFKNILIINSSESWADCNSAACNFENIHGYGYPADLAANVGFVFRGNGNFIRGISVDTPMNKGIVVEGDYNTFSDISVGGMQSATGVGFEVSGNANTFDGVRCSAYYCFYILSGTNTIDEFKCLRLQSKSEYDYYFTGKLPYRGVFDTKTEATNNIKRYFIFNDQWFYQSVLTFNIDFGIEHRYNTYNVRLVGVKESAPNYSVEKTTTGCSITCTDAITKGKNVNVLIEPSGIVLV